MKYIIVKHAAPGFIEHYFEKDSNSNGEFHISYSVYYTHTGKKFDKLYYEENELELANQHCDYLNRENPVGGYAVKKLKESSLSEKD